MTKIRDKLNTMLKPDIAPDWPAIPKGFDLIEYKKLVRRKDRYLCRDRMTEKMIWHVVPKHSIGKKSYFLGPVIREK